MKPAKRFKGLLSQDVKKFREVREFAKKTVLPAVEDSDWKDYLLTVNTVRPNAPISNFLLRKSGADRQLVALIGNRQHQFGVTSRGEPVMQQSRVSSGGWVHIEQCTELEMEWWMESAHAYLSSVATNR